MELTKNQALKILNKQAAAVKAPKDFFKPFEEDRKMPENWYTMYTWTVKQESDFRDWMVKFLKKNTEFRCLNEKKLRECIAWWMLDYGWKYSD